MLLDTGPLVALLDRRDFHHETILDLFPSLIDRLVTSEAVVTEATHLTGRSGRGNVALPLEFILQAEIPVAPLTTEGYRRCAILMRKYAGTPMDFADATLVALSDPLGIDRVFTLDQRGFAAYVGARGKKFSLLPE